MCCGGSESGEIKPGDNFSSVGKGKQKQKERYLVIKKYSCYNLEYISFSHRPGEPGVGCPHLLDMEKEPGGNINQDRCVILHVALP